MRKFVMGSVVVAAMLGSSPVKAWDPNYAYGRGYNYGYGGWSYNPMLTGTPVNGVIMGGIIGPEIYYNVPAPINAAPLNSVIIKNSSGIIKQPANVVVQRMPVCYDTRRWDTLQGWVYTRTCH